MHKSSGKQAERLLKLRWWMHNPAKFSWLNKISFLGDKPVSRTFKMIIILFVLWLFTFVLITIASSDWGNSGEDGWSMSWGYPRWLWLTGDEYGGMDRWIGKGQWEIVCNKYPLGKLDIEILGLLHAATVPFMPMAFSILFHMWLKNKFQIHINTIIQFILVGLAVFCLDLLISNVFSMISTAWEHGNYTECILIVLPCVSTSIAIYFSIVIICILRPKKNMRY
jgi:hypothetical protein